MICITMYDERREEFEATIKGLVDNLSEPPSEPSEPPSGPSEPPSGPLFTHENSLAVVIVDGLEKLTDDHHNKQDSFLNFLEDIKLYNADYVNLFCNYAAELDEIQYVLAFEANLSFNRFSIVSTEDKKSLKVLFVIKRHNRSKLDSHFLFMLGICPQFKELETILMLDVGTCPKKGSVEMMLSELDKKSVYGVCGQIKIRKRFEFDDLIVNFQKIDYVLMQTCLKNYEDITDSIQCLPGAFSAYSSNILEEKSQEQRSTEYLMQTYFKSLTDNRSSGYGENITHKMSEDRILVGELYCAGKKSRYVEHAVATVDPTTQLHTLLAQRKRWFIGTIFAMKLYHTWGVKKQLIILNNLGWLMSPCFFQIILHLLIYVFQTSVCSIELSNLCNPLVYRIPQINIFVTSLTCIIALMASADQVKWYWKAVCAYYCVLVCLLVYIFIRLLTEDSFILGWQVMLGFMVAIVGLHIFAVLLSKDWSGLLCLPHYFLILPTYVNVIVVFAICRTDDFSWGTRDFPSDIEHNYSKIKAKYLQGFVALTTILAVVVI
jgi:chitin synthase